MNESNRFKNDKLNTWHNGMERLKERFYNSSLETKIKILVPKVEQLRRYGKANALGTLNLRLQ